jgi:nucleoid DNA-binding protein
MDKQGLVRHAAGLAGRPQYEMARVVSDVMASITTALAAGEGVEIDGFGTLSTKKRADGTRVEFKAADNFFDRPLPSAVSVSEARTRAKETPMVASVRKALEMELSKERVIVRSVSDARQDAAELRCNLAEGFVLVRLSRPEHGFFADKPVESDARASSQRTVFGVDAQGAAAAYASALDDALSPSGAAVRILEEYVHDTSDNDVDYLDSVVARALGWRDVVSDIKALGAWSDPDGRKRSDIPEFLYYGFDVDGWWFETNRRGEVYVTMGRSDDGRAVEAVAAREEVSTALARMKALVA